MLDRAARGAKRLARQAWMSVFSTHPYEYAARAPWLGAIVRKLPRSYVEDVERGVFTGRGGLMGAIVRGELERSYYASPEAVQRERIRALWAGEAGRAWHADKLALYGDRERFEREFLPYRQPLVDALVALVAGRDTYHTLCEIGTGNGLFLRYLSDALPSLRRVVGIDLSTAQIQANRQAYRDTRLEFLSCEALDWVTTEGRPGTVFVACGTLECLTGPELLALVRHIAATCGRAAFGLVEPVSFDLDVELESRPRGAMTFSHNYGHVFTQADYQIRMLDRTPIDARVKHYESVAMLAVCGE